MLLLLIGFRTCTPVYGMELPAQEETSGMNTKTEENDVREMGSRIPVYETLGEAVKIRGQPREKYRNYF